MKIFIFILSSFLCVSTNAQRNYIITYKGDFLTDASILSHFGNPVFVDAESRLVFNDSMSYFFSLQDNRNRFKEKVYGRQLLDYSVYFNKNKGLIETAYTKNIAQENYLVSDSTKIVNWIFLDQAKIINGYTCSAALTVSADNDSTLAFYTKDLPQPFGPERYNSLPGVILEIYDQSADWHLVATKIDNDNFTIAYPKNYTSISKNEFSLQHNVIYGKRKANQRRH